MITAIIFSRFRPMQLEALLHSMQVHTPGVFRPVALPRVDPEYRAGYEIVRREHPEADIQFRQDLRKDLLRELRLATPLVALHVDDDLFYRDMTEEQSQIPDDCFCFAPRLGDNITYAYRVDKPEKPGEYDFVYPFALDGNTFRRDEILQMITPLQFSNPSELEDRLHRSQGAKPHKIHYLPHSVMVNIPHNHVTHFVGRSAGGSCLELNQRFMAGERIDIAAMDFSDVIGVHQEIPFKFRLATL